jgi:hypothetical protein
MTGEFTILEYYQQKEELEREEDYDIQARKDWRDRQELIRLRKLEKKSQGYYIKKGT